MQTQFGWSLFALKSSSKSEWIKRNTLFSLTAISFFCLCVFCLFFFLRFSSSSFVSSRFTDFLASNDTWFISNDEYSWYVILSFEILLFHKFFYSVCWAEIMVYDCSAFHINGEENQWPLKFLFTKKIKSVKSQQYRTNWILR